MDPPNALVDRSTIQPTHSWRLDTYFPVLNDDASPTSKTRLLDDSDIHDISDILREQNSPWATVPRLYAIFRIIGKPEEVDNFVAHGINDLWLPLTTKTFPRGVNPTIRSQFLEAQAFVSSRSLDLEKGERGPHRHFATIEDVPLSSQGFLGKGSYGEVDLVKSTLTGSVYARKRIPRSTPGQSGDTHNRQVMADFEKEIKAFKHLNHRHIVKLVGSYTDPSSIALLFSPVADTDMRSFLETFTLTPTSRRLLYSFFGCLAAGLEYMHHMNVRHKDVKPANLLVKGNTVLYTDLGLAFHWESVGHGTTEDSFPTATRKYSPPEFFDGGKRNTAADIWSLGCVFLEMATRLLGPTLPKMQEHLESYGTKSSIYGRNLDGVITWIDQLRGITALGNSQLPLDLIKEMMSKSYIRRPSAHAVFERLCALSEMEEPLTGSCCLPEIQPKQFTSFLVPTTNPLVEEMPLPSASINPEPPSLDNLSIVSSDSTHDRALTPSSTDSGRHTPASTQSMQHRPSPQSAKGRIGRASLVKNTSLITAILQNDVSKARSLLEEGADINYQDFQGNTPLTRAVMTSNTAMVALFLEKGADVHLLNKENETCFHFACNRANFAIINMLIENGANVKQRGYLGRTPFIYATTNNYCDRRLLINFLLSHGISPKECQDDGASALHRAAYFGSDDVIELLLSLGINISCMDNNQITPMYHAASMGRISVVAKLLSLGSPIEIPRNDGMRPLIIAAVNGHAEVVERLLQAGADINARNNFGNSALVCPPSTYARKLPGLGVSIYFQDNLLIVMQ